MELTAFLDTLMYIMKSLCNIFQFYAALMHKFYISNLKVESYWIKCAIFTMQNSLFAMFQNWQSNKKYVHGNTTIATAQGLATIIRREYESEWVGKKVISIFLIYKLLFLLKFCCPGNPGSNPTGSKSFLHSFLDIFFTNKPKQWYILPKKGKKNLLIFLI